MGSSWLRRRPAALRVLLEAINANDLAAARESKKKFGAEDIPAVTQLFTIRWVVRYLVEMYREEIAHAGQPG